MSNGEYKFYPQGWTSHQIGPDIDLEDLKRRRFDVLERTVQNPDWKDSENADPAEDVVVESFDCPLKAIERARQLVLSGELDKAEINNPRGGLVWRRVVVRASPDSLGG